MVVAAKRLEVERTKFPAMNVDEILIWKEWLRLHEFEWMPLPDFWIALRQTQPGRQPFPGDKFDYNVHIGTGRDPGPGFEANIRQMAIRVTQSRLDAVGFKGDTPYIFEVKRVVTSRQIGQVLGYAATWRETKVTPIPAIPMLVGGDFNENDLHLLQQVGIKLDIVPVSFAQLSPYNTAPVSPT